MRKRVLLTGAMMATMLTISACGSKNITEATTTVETTTTMETTVEESTTERPTATAEGMESEKAEDLTLEQIKSFAEEVQAAVTVQDIGRLANLSSYPVYVSLEKGEDSKIKSVGDFVAIGEGKLFTEKLMTQTTDMGPEELKVFGAGVIIGEDVNITSNNVDEKPETTGINL